MRKDRLTATIIGLVVGIAGTLGLKGCSLPIPTPFVPDKGDHVVVIVDETAPSIPASIALNSPRLMALREKGKFSLVHLRETQFIAAKNYAPLLQKAGGAPAMLVMTTGNGCVHAGRLPTDIKVLDDTLTEHVKDLPPPMAKPGDPDVISNGEDIQLQQDAESPFIVDPSGTKRRLTYKPNAAKFKALKRYGDHMPVFPEAEWVEVNRDAVFAAKSDDKVSWIYDQGRYGSCVGQGNTGALRRLRFMFGMKDVKLSPTYLYSLINGNQDNGAIISDGAEAMKKYGTCTFDLVGQDKIYQRQMPSNAKTEAAQFKADDYYACDSWAETVSAIIAGHQVTFGNQVGNNWGRFDKYGACGHDRGPGNHCISADGLIKLGDGRWALRAYNSWGDDWGPFKNGRMYLDKEHLFGGGCQPDVIVIRRPSRRDNEPNDPPAYRPAAADGMKLAF